jgi:short-subunit dehydrogenase
MKNLNGRVAVVTGSGSGIGRAAAIELARCGCAVALVDINRVGLAETRNEIERNGGRATIHVADVSNRERMAELPGEVTAQHGGCHILVNNAGVLSVGRFTEDTLADIDWIVGINVYGVIHGCHYFLPLLQQADEAHIVNVSSMAAFMGLPQNAVYSLTKGAIRSFTEALRGELASTSIGVNALFPGAVSTNILESSRGAQSARLAAFGRMEFSHFLARSPGAAARKIVRAIKHNKPRVLLGPDSRMLDIIARLFPGRNKLIGRALDLLCTN